LKRIAKKEARFATGLEGTEGWLVDPSTSRLRRFAQDIACGLPLGVASLTPAERL
jgi:hypothetical protein